MDLDKKLLKQAADYLKKNKSTIAVAESVTAGNLQVAFSLMEGASDIFQGGITAYNIGQKCRHLGVEPTHALKYNCVSDKISRQMAVNVCSLFTSDYGIGITGYAEPVPAQNIHSLFAFISIAKNNKLLVSKRIKASKGNINDVQVFYTRAALKLLVSVLK